MAGLDGKTLGPYRVIAQIGLGGMAKIYKAYQPSMDRIVALKVLPEHYAQDPQFVERFYREARTIAQLEHPNILPVYDFGEQDGITYLVMRFLDGGTLQELMEKQRLSLHQTVDILVQVCAALDYAHRKGVIHRDVKPSNVLIDREGLVYLSDFGIAKVLESASRLTQTGTALGTPAYMSPEQCMGTPIDKRSDIYSLGVLMYEMAVGKVPFKADTPMAVLFAHLHEPLPMPRSNNPAISEELQLVILKAMAKDPNDRYQTAAEMGAALRRAKPPEELKQPQAEQAAEIPPAVPAQPPHKAVSPAGQIPAEEPLAAPEPALSTAPGPEPAPAPPAVETPVRRTILVTGKALKKETPDQEQPSSTIPRKRPLGLVLGLGLAVLLGVAILGRGLFPAIPGSTPQVTLQSILAATAPPTKPAQIVPPSPTPRPSATRRPTITPRPEPILMADFGDPAFEGKLNPDLWSPSEQDGCQVIQKEGVLSIGNQARPDPVDCNTGMRVPGIRGFDLVSMEASFRVEPGFVGDGPRTALAMTADLPKAGGIREGFWSVKCGILKQKDLSASLWIEDARMGDEPAAQSVYSSAIPIPPEEWVRLRLQVEPDTMTFSCWMNGRLVGMYNPVSEQKTLREAVFHPHLFISRPPQARMTVSLDELVFLPTPLVPRAAEVIRPEPGCLPPPEGIVGWWTGDGALDNLLSAGRGQGEGAWGFAKGMVGQAYAFQNFPSRGGGVYFPPYPQINNLQTASVEGWVLIDAGPFKRIDRFLTMGAENLVIRHDGFATPGTLHFYIKVNGQLQHISSQRLLKAGVFNHVAGTYDGTTMTLYLNGVPINRHSVKGKLATAENAVSFSGGETLDGLLDEFTLYNRALNADEIQAIYQAGAAGKCRP